MKGTLALKTGPASEPVSTAAAKAHIRVEAAFTDDDTLIAGLVSTARRWIEDITGIRMVTQTWYYYLDAFPAGDVLYLPIGPVTAITSVTYVKSDATTGTVSASDYDTDFVSLPSRISLKDGSSWPADELKIVNGVIVEFIVGYGAASGLVAARAALLAAEALVAAATSETLAAAQSALAAAAAAVAAAEAAQVAEVPNELILAVKMLVEHFYEHRGAVTELTLETAPMAVKSLISGFRLWQGG